jgi:hypothetical protein
MPYRYLTLEVKFINGEVERHEIDKEKYPNCRWEWTEAHEGYHPAQLTIIYSNNDDDTIMRYVYLQDKVVGVKVLVSNEPEPF